MSGVKIQKHLPCHDYHMGNCTLTKAQCPYSHEGRSWGICPNKNHCPTPHKLVDCPLFLNNCCPKGENCSYRHKSKEDTTQKSCQEQITCANVEEIQKNDSSLELKNSQVIKGLTMEDFKSSLVELNQDLKILLPIILEEKEKAKQMHSSCSLDLCFVVDISGSMSSWMNHVVQYVGNTLNTIYQQFPAITLRVAFSGYRDINDFEQYVQVDFTRNIEDFKTRLSKVSCGGGGGDWPEDVTGGLNNALNFGWGSAAKQLIFIADYPAHGLKYHDNLIDNYPKGCPNGLKLEDLMSQFSFKKIDFTVVEVSQSTKKMFQIMTQYYGQNLVIKNLLDNNEENGTASFQNVVHDSIKSTVTASLSKSGLNNDNSAQPQGQFSQAIRFILQNKRFKKGLSWSFSKEKSSKLPQTLIQQQAEQEQVLEEEEEYDSDDSEYETKLEQTAQKQLKQAIKDKEYRKQKEKEEKLEKLKKSFPSHYFDTVEQHEEKNKKKQKEKVQKTLYQTGYFDWDNFENYNDYQAVCYSFELVKNYKEGQEINWKNLEIKTFYLGTKVRISNLVFSEGAMRYAYHAKDLYLNQKMVAKQYKKPEKQTKISIEEMKRDIISQIVCKYIVKEFNSKLVEIEQSEALILQFIDCYIYETTHPYNASPRYYFEKYIDGTYEKFNNNAGYVSQTDNPYSSLAQALSHFSWQISKGYLAIVDLQGNQEGILTDPQVHCLDQEKFGDGNLGYEGILRFFSTHDCNDHCKKLQLIHPFDQNQIPVNNTFFQQYTNSDKENEINDSQPLMSQLCDICQTTSYFNIKRIVESKKNNERLICKDCIEQIKRTTFSKKCVQCPDQLQFSTYECIQLRRDAPPLCNKCQLNQ
ncbi:MHCK/EF2 kinase domain protein (macronuclear) [Tetrahymena thermophila SB210]|uniref:MHCK/EF2 kinase domain protein n=1 Tax=Tetrahymena thermophila (strain SB210) TaxID=312017 RepID=I7MEM3_TETTS|nr:MHCK/EF2 kinase domain protein [Tetrahymena thermophila SB210]EAR97191.1 MHCK/EF2 kinase domain protein [Tetrahymena thermophila SB210]|eukprot:XP_001017436.1 MHCK/EF2 kinase domain protein [Tetrahymena thermophila SB210]